MKRFLLILSIVELFLTSCGPQADSFRLTGNIKHLREGEFYLFFPNGEKEGIDTIKVKDGSFQVDVPLEQSTVVTLQYPNFLQHTVFATPGKTVKMEAVAEDLPSASFSGTTENDDFTALRKQMLNKSNDAKRKMVVTYIKQHPESEVSVFLLERTFLRSVNKDLFKQAKTLLVGLLKAQPKNIRLMEMKSVIDRQLKHQVGSAFPSYSYTTLQQKHDSVQTCKDKQMIVLFWATWDAESYQLLCDLNRYMEQNESKTKVLCISLDGDVTYWQNMVRYQRGGIIHTIEPQGWNATVVQQLGVGQLPYCVVLDEKHKIKEMQPTLQRLQKIVDEGKDASTKQNDESPKK